MGKKGGTTNSWLTAVKRAFRSPIKDSENKTSRRKVEHHHEDDEDKKTERRRWLFGRHPKHNNINNFQPNEEKETAPKCIETKTPLLPAQQRHFIANPASFKRNRAAKIIQTAFRGYLARKALIALKGIVKLQALIRGQNLRRQASMTMKRMEALLRVQARVQDQRARLVMDSRRRSMFAETNNLFDSKYLKDRKLSTWREMEDWRDSCPRTLEELEAILKARNEAVTKNQQWESRSRTSIDYKRASIKTVETESLRSSINGRRSHCQSPVHRHSTAHTRPRSPQVRAASPCRTPHEDRSHSTANTPSMRSTQRWNSSISRYSTSTNDGGIPNYMAATESAKARIRSQSAPRQRPSTPEKERGGSVKKRLSYPVPDPYSAFGQNLRSPSFKSVQARYLGMEEQSNYSCYTESIGGEISPCSTTDLRRWLR